MKSYDSPPLPPSARLPYGSLCAYLKNNLTDAAAGFEEALAREARSRGLHGVVCGHIHHPAIRRIEGTLYCNDAIGSSPARRSPKIGAGGSKSSPGTLQPRRSMPRLSMPRQSPPQRDMLETIEAGSITKREGTAMRYAHWTVAAAFVTAACIGGAYAAQQQDFSKVEVKTTDLGHDTYMLEGAGGNVTVAVGTDGVIMVDAQFAPMHDKLKAAIAKITDKPVKYLINTHYHGDHTGGNAAFGKEGVIIVAHQNLKNRLANPPAGANGQIPAAAPAEALPKEVYTDKTTVSTGGRTAQITHIEAHTDTDSVVYFPNANVLAIGDTGGANRYPNIALGGSIDGMIQGVGSYIAIANDQTKIVPGHGRLADKADLVAYRDMLVSIKDRVSKLKTEGKSADEAVAAKPLADLQAKLNQTDDASERVVRQVYASLK
jgi:glyoxylase-like metal-dependent hydrolase (beta-lactamase superfamily II)